MRDAMLNIARQDGLLGVFASPCSQRAAQQGRLGGNTEQLCFLAMTRQNGFEQCERFDVTAHRRHHLGGANGGEPIVGIARLQPGI